MMGDEKHLDDYSSDHHDVPPVHFGHGDIDSESFVNRQHSRNNTNVEEDSSNQPKRSVWGGRGVKVFGGVVLLLLVVLAIVLGVTLSPSGQSAPATASSSTPQETSEQFLALKSVIVEAAVTPEAAFDDASSPQYRALKWLADEDTYEFVYDSTNVTAEMTRQATIQRYALATFYYALGGETWSFPLNFLSHIHECFWNGVLEVRGPTGSQLLRSGVICEQGSGLDIDALSLPLNNLLGTLPNEVYSLSNVHTLSFPANNITGTIDSRIGNMSRLTTLDLQKNVFDGELPSSIRSLTELFFLGLTGNYLEGTFPPLDRASKLGALFLAHNGFYGTIPDWISKLSSLQILDLSYNAFNGTIPSSLPTLKNLTQLWVESNELRGTVPQNFQNMTKLALLSLRANNLTGDINFLCTKTPNLTIAADCLPFDNKSQVNCSCCSLCCNEVIGCLSGEG